MIKSLQTYSGKKQKQYFFLISKEVSNLQE